MKEYVSKPKEFIYLATLILGFGVAYLLLKFDFSANNKDFMSLIWGFALFLALFLTFWSYGKKKRIIRIDEIGIEYYNPKLNFTANFSDIILVKSYQEMEKSTENLIVMTEDNTLSISTAFYEKAKLVDVFNSMIAIAPKYPNIKIEDDRLWEYGAEEKVINEGREIS